MDKDRKGKGKADEKEKNVDDEPGTDELYPTNEMLSDGDTVATHGRNQSATTGEDDKTEAYGVGTSPEANANMNRGKWSDAELAELATSDLQRAYRIVYNRVSAAKSRKRKLDQQASQNHQMSALQLQNQQLQQENQQLQQEIKIRDTIIVTLREENSLMLSQVVQNSRTRAGQAGMMPFGVPQNLAAMSPQFYGRPLTINEQPGIGQSLWSAQQLQLQQQQLLRQAPHAPQPHQMMLQQQVDQQQGVGPSLRSAQQLQQLQLSQAPHQRLHPPQPHQMWRPQHVEAAGEGAHAAGEGDHDAGEEADAPRPGSE